MCERNVVSASIGVLLILILACLLCGCGTTRYVPMETVRTDSIYLTKVERDSIHVTDSVTVVVKGDTVWRDRLRIMYIDRQHSDTAYIERVDTITIPVPVEAQLTRWQEVCFGVGQAAVVCLFLGVLAVAVWFLYKRL